MNPIKKEELMQNVDSIPSELRAVLLIVDADADLKSKTSNYVSVERREINWDQIFKTELSTGQRAAMLWGKSIWTDRAPARVDAFDRAFAMEPQLRAAVLNALALRWGLAT